MSDHPNDDGAHGSVFRGLIHEPLFHFFVLGALIFGAYAWLAPQTAQVTAEREQIIVTPGRLQQLVHVFQRTWRRPPTQAEFNRLIESYVREEIYYREAVKLGLDEDDTVIRRRMQQKMQFLSEPSEAELQPTEAELESLLQANRAGFRAEPQIAFEQFFVRVDADLEAAEARARKLLGELQEGAGKADLASLGDQTRLDHRYRLTSVSGIARHFGPDFTDALTKLPREEWTGPIRSPFGLHLVRITAYAPGRDPPLSEVRDAVLQKWRAEKRDAFIAAEYERMREGYDVVLPFEPETGPRKVSQK
jgi:hypothetical protein